MRHTTKAFHTVPSKQNCFQSGPKEISNNRSRPLLKLSRQSLPKRNCCQSGPPKHLPERALRKLSRRVLPKRNWYQTGPSTTPNYLSELLVKLSRRSLENKTAAKSGPRWHSTAGLTLRRLSRLTEKRNCWNGPQNIHLPERALRKLSRRASPKRNCIQTGPSATSNYRGGS